MLIQIESVTKDGPRKVRIEPVDGEPFEFTAPSLKDAHKMLKDAREGGFESLRPKKGK